MRLTLAVLLGSPVLVTAMMATLFRPGAFYPGDPADAGPAQTVFWIAFDGFFFGLTYGLLQIVGELAIFRRECLAGLSVGAYVAAKIAALFPVLVAVSILQVLFAGAVVPVADMAVPGRLLSFGLSTRYTFEALGHEFELGRYADIVPSMGGYGDTFDHATTGSLLTLTAITIVLTLTTVWVLHRRSRRERPSNGGCGLARAAERDSAR
ncbi:hypothetical protein MXD62_29205 [Frankia sp. Mgl5]|nr:hypothetical protein [Frankia sp. Mgl5]MCK9931170.1 hypothetical protein [Frankia sp. Mgl5]